MGKKLRLVLAMVLVLCMSTVFAACGSKTITGIVMDPDTMPSTTIGIDESFSIGEANKIIVTYDNGSTSKWSITESMVTYNPYPGSDNKWSKPQTVTVTVTFSRLGTTVETTFELHIVAEGEAGALIDEISALDLAGLTYADKGTVDALMARYNKLTDVEKSYITNYDTLVAAVEKIAALGEEVASIVLTAPVTTAYNVGDVMNWNGAYATITKVNGAINTVALTEENATITGFTTEADGEKTVTIAYEGATVEYKITVTDGAKVELEAAIAAFNALVDELPTADALQYTQVAQVEKARAAYAALVADYGTDGKLDGVTDAAVKALEDKITANNAAVQEIIETFIPKDKVKYSNKAKIVASRTAFDNIANGWTGYVTEEQKAILTASEAVIVEMEKRIEQFRTLVAQLPAVADYSVTEHGAVVAGACTALEELLFGTLKFEEPDDENYAPVADKAGVRPEFDKIASILLYPNVVAAFEALEAVYENGDVVEPETWENATDFVDAYEKGAYPTDATLVEALEDLKTLVETIEAEIKELTDLIDALFATSAGASSEAGLMPLSGGAEPTAYEAKKATILTLIAELEESSYNKLIDAEYGKKLADAKVAFEAADALIAEVQAAIDGAAIVDSLEDVAAVEALYTKLAGLKVFGTDAYTSKLKETTAEAFFGVNLTSEVDRTSLDEMEVAFVQGIIDAISTPIKYEQQGEIARSREEFALLSAANKAKIVGMDAKLAAAEAQIAAFKDQAADATAKIDAITTPVTLDVAGKAAVEAARDSYDLLTDGWKELVSAERLEKLMNAEQALVDMQKAVDELLEIELPADADLMPGDYVAETVGEVTTYTGVLGNILNVYNALVEGHAEIANRDDVKAFKDDLDALIEVVCTEDAKVKQFNDGVAAFAPNYDVKTAALRNQLASIRANWKTVALITDYVAAVEDDPETENDETAPETTNSLDAFDAVIKAENDAITAFLAVALPTVADLTYEQYTTPIATYANIFEQSKALYDELAVYTTENNADVIARFELLTALFIDIPAQGVEGDDDYVPAVDSEITKLNKSVTAVEAMIDQLSATFVYAEKEDITAAYNAYKALAKGWIAAVAGEKATKIEALYAALGNTETAIEELKTDIDALPEPGAMNYSNLSAIEAARDDYNTIVENGIDATLIKELVGTELCNKLAALEERVTKLTKTAQAIQEMIDAIDAATYASKAAVEEARGAYDEFNGNGQGFHALNNIANLVAAEEYIAECEANCDEFLQYVTDNLPAKAEDLTLAQAGKIAGAEELYNELDADIQAYNKAVGAAKALIDACKAQDVANKAAVEEFVAGVTALPVVAIPDDPDTAADESGWNTDALDITFEPAVSNLNEMLDAFGANGYDELTKPGTEPAEMYITEEILSKLAAATDKIGEITAKIQDILDEIEAIEKLDETNTVVNYANVEAIMTIITTKFDALTDAEKNSTIGQKIEAYRTSINTMIAKAEAYVLADKAVVVDALNYTEASRNSVINLRAAYNALVDGWNTYSKTTGEGETAVTVAVSDVNLLAAEDKIEGFRVQLNGAEVLARAIDEQNFVLEASATPTTETVIAYSNRAEIVAAYNAYVKLNDVVGLQAAFDAELLVELNRVYGIVTDLDAAVGTEIADEIAAAFTPLYTKVTMASKPAIDKFFIMIGELAETEEVKAFRNGWGAYLAVGYPNEYELLNDAKDRYEDLLAGEETFKAMVQAMATGVDAEDVTYAMKGTLEEIREFYKEKFVTESDREKIRALDEYKTLEAFESAWKLRYLEAQDVAAMIDAIDPSKLSDEVEKQKVNNAKAAYDAIKAEEYGFEESIENYNKLLGYLDELAEKFETPEAIKNFLDSKVTGEWNTFADVSYGIVKDFLDKVYVNYNTLLTDEQRNEFSAADQQKIADFKVAGDKLMSDLASLQDKINALDPTAVDLSAAEPTEGAVYLVKEALKVVEKTDADDNAAVTNKTTWKNKLNLYNLTTAEDKIAAIKNAMTDFIAEVASLPAADEIDFESAQDVFTAQKHYNELSAEAKLDAGVQAAYAQLTALLTEASKYTKFSEVYAGAVSAFATAFYNKPTGTEFTDLSKFYLETITLPAGFTNLKVANSIVGDEDIKVSVGNNNFINAPAFKMSENGKKLLLALPLVGTSLSNGELKISYTNGGETVTKTLIAYTVQGSLKKGEVNAVYLQAGYESTVTFNGSMVTFKSEHGAAAVSIPLNNNGATIVGVPNMFVKYVNLDTSSESVPTYAFTAFEESGCVIYPKYSNGPITQETASTEAQSRMYYISVDGYGTISVLLSYEYVVKA